MYLYFFTSCMYGSCFHGLIIAASPCIFVGMAHIFFLYPSVIFDKLSGMRKAVALCGIGALKGAAGSHCHFAPFRYYIKGLIRKTEGPFIITRSLCLYGIIVTVQQISAFYCSNRKKVDSRVIKSIAKGDLGWIFSSNREGY